MTNEDWSNVENPDNVFHRRRMYTIGASDMPIILGVSPYKTPLDLYKDKVSFSPRNKQNFAQARGTEMEPIARAWFNKTMMLDFQPKLVAHPDVAAFTASLDGWCEKTKQAVEIKFSGKEDHATAKGGKIPTHYLPQVEWQYIVTNAKHIYYLSYQENDSVILDAPKPSDERKGEMIKAAANFLEMVRARIEPPLSKNDYMQVKSDEHLQLAERYKQALAALEGAKALVEDLRQQMITGAKILGHDKIDYGSCLVYRTVKSGAVDYTKIPQLGGVDLAPYRKPDIETYTVKVKGK